MEGFGFRKISNIEVLYSGYGGSFKHSGFLGLLALIRFGCFCFRARSGSISSNSKIYRIYIYNNRDILLYYIYIDT